MAIRTKQYYSAICAAVPHAQDQTPSLPSNSQISIKNCGRTDSYDCSHVGTFSGARGPLDHCCAVPRIAHVRHLPLSLLRHGSVQACSPLSCRTESGPCRPRYTTLMNVRPSHGSSTLSRVCGHGFTCLDLLTLRIF